MHYFIDTSVLVSWYVKETLTEKTKVLLEDDSYRFYISRLVETEFYSALAIKKRMAELSKQESVHIGNLFQKHIEEGMLEMIYLTDEMLLKAIEILRHHKTSLKTVDALHVATCIVTQLKLVTADKILAASAKALGVTNHFIK